MQPHIRAHDCVIHVVFVYRSIARIDSAHLSSTSFNPNVVSGIGPIRNGHKGRLICMNDAIIINQYYEYGTVIRGSGATQGLLKIWHSRGSIDHRRQA